MQRLNKEYGDIQMYPPAGITATTVNDSLYEWTATIVGPQGTPYENGIFNLKVKFPGDYPFQPPKVRFTTKIYHCNVNSDGEICLDILKDTWSPALTISSVLLSISSLLSDPNPNDPLVADIAKLYTTNKTLHDQKAREWTLKHCIMK